MATRTRKQTIPATPFVETVAPESVAPEMPKFDWAHIIKGDASWKRWAIASVAALAASCVVSYLGGMLVGMLTFSAAVLSGSAFITTLVYVLGILLVMYAAYRASMFSYVKVIDKTVDAKCSAAYNWVTGLFSSTIEVQHA